MQKSLVLSEHFSRVCDQFRNFRAFYHTDAGVVENMAMAEPADRYGLTISRTHSTTIDIHAYVQAPEAARLSGRIRHRNRALMSMRHRTKPAC
jgi:hypothetical protein